MPSRHVSTGQNDSKSHMGDSAAYLTVGDCRRLAVLPLDFEPIRVPYDPPHDVGDEQALFGHRQRVPRLTDRRRRVADDAEVDRLLVFASTAKLFTPPDKFLLLRQVAAVVLLKLLPGDYPIFVVVLEKPIHRRANLAQASLDGVQLPPGVVLWSRGHLFPPVACHSLRIGKRAYLGVDPCDESLLVQRYVGTRRLILLGAGDADIADRSLPPMFHVATTAAETASEQAAQDTLARGRAAVDV